mmetsp:Transcript_25047/g.83579  ORF Transcript_25047/g.83579 Transcript_25047/m.83579 type:complete len:228 (+) Transcript_25047:225-908(+)
MSRMTANTHSSGVDEDMKDRVTFKLEDSQRLAALIRRSLSTGLVMEESGDDSPAISPNGKVVDFSLFGAIFPAPPPGLTLHTENAQLQGPPAIELPLPSLVMPPPSAIYGNRRLRLPTLVSDGVKWDTEESSTNASDSGGTCGPVGTAECPSEGSRGHPECCLPPCKYASKARGCKDGSACGRCHLCPWGRTKAPRRKAALSDENSTDSGSVTQQVTPVRLADALGI